MPSTTTADRTQPSAESATHGELLDAYRLMLTSRRMDEKQLILLKQGKSFFHIGGSGHEAAQIAMASALEPGRDWAFPYYRDIAFVLRFGMSIRDIFLAALHRGEDPSTGARQMPGHWGGKQLHIVTQSSPTGTQYLQAVGVALAAKKEGRGSPSPSVRARSTAFWAARYVAR